MECREEAPPGKSRCREHSQARRRSFGRSGRAGTSGWAEYTQKFPDRANFYQSGGWKAARDRHLAEHPNCVVCGATATIVDHVRNRAEGGADLDPANLASMCAEHHKAKTLDESHRGRKRAAQQRKGTT